MKRRNFVIGLGLASAGTAFARAAAHAEPMLPIETQLEGIARIHTATLGLYAVNLADGFTITYGADGMFAVCSTFKTYAAAAILQRVERGELILQDAVAVTAADIVANSPVTETAVGTTLTLAELCQAALQRSDNAAANLLLRTLGGPAAVTDFARSIGDQVTRLDRWETELNSAVPNDPRDTSTPRALGEGYRGLLTGPVLTEASRLQLDEWMRGNLTSAQSMRAGLPADWTSADKTGSGDYGSTNDVGIAYGPAGERLLIAVMTRSAVDDADAENMRPLIAAATSAAVPVLLGAAT